MNEIEIFLKLIDENEADRILKYFNETPIGTRKTKATFDQKKQHIKKIFKSATPNMIRKRRKGAADPFYSYINNYTLSEEPPLERFKEYLNFVNESKNTVSSYRRYSLMLLKFPEQIREKYIDIQENIENGRDPLDLNENFEDKDELKNYLTHIRSFIGRDAPKNIIHIIENYQPNQYEELLEKCKKEVENFDLLQYYNSKDELEAKYGITVSNAAYILTHEYEDHEIAILLAVESMYCLLKSYREVNSEETINELKDISQKLLNLEKEKENQLKEKEQQLESIKLEVAKFRKTIKSLNKDNNKMKEKISDYQSMESIQKTQLDKVQVEHKKILNGIKKDLNHKIRDLESKLKLIDIVNSYKVNKFNSDIEYKTDWAIICNADYELFKELYPELNIVHAEYQEEWEATIVDERIREVYLFMKGLSTRQFKNIKSLVEENNKEYKSVELDSFKEFMDWIGYIKVIKRKVFTK
jgi:hypothetical protein